MGFKFNPLTFLGLDQTGTSGSGTVTSISTGTGLTGGPITGSGTISLANTAVSPGSFTNANITVDAQGRVTSATSGSSSVALSAITAATTTNTIANANNTQSWNWDTLTTQTALQLGSTAVTSGSLLNLVVNTPTQTGPALNINMPSNASAGIGIKASVSSPNSTAAQFTGSPGFNIAPVVVISNEAGTALRVSSDTSGLVQPLVVANTDTAGSGPGNTAQMTFSANILGDTLTPITGIAGIITDVTALSYKGSLLFKTANNAAPVEQMRIKHDGSVLFPTTITPGGTTGNQTINKISGTVNIATGISAVTVTNSLVTANSIVFAVVRTNDASAIVKNVVPGSGTFTINLNAASAAESSVGFWVINQ